MLFTDNVKRFDLSTLLVASYLLLVPFGRLSNVPMAVMFLLGIKLLVLHQVDLGRREYKFFSFVFLCFYIPIICSFPDAVNPGNVASVAGFYLSYFFSGIYIIKTLANDPVKQNYLLKLCAFILLFWMVDALAQAAFGYDIFGFRFHGNDLNGLFGEKNPKLGIYLAALSPILFVYASRYFHLLVWVLVTAGASAVVLLSGRRTGLVMLFIVLICFALWQVFGEKRISFRWLVAVGLFFCLICLSFYFCSSYVKARVNQSALVFSGNYEVVNQGLSNRLPIWKTALRMIKAHPVNGVGARGFRYAYIDYADAEDTFVDKKDSVGAFQAHQLILDVLCNTGAIGLLGLIVTFCMLFVSWARASMEEKQRLIPYALVLTAVFSPINSHFATYSSQWSSMLFWIIALYFSHLNTAVLKEHS